MSIDTGTRLGAYEVKELLGRGAMGVVYRAHHAGLNRQAAVKVLQALAPDADAAARFRREAQSIAQMRHPNVLQVFDYGEWEGVPYSIVEYVPGGSLADRLRAGQMPGPPAAVNLLAGVAAALDYAHSLGIIHRDVKPANVLLGKDETPVLADFGLVKLLQSASVRSITGVTTGTPAYMSPEQVTGGDITPAADRYALACVAYELLTGSVPFEGLGVIELLYAHVHREAPRASELVPSLAPAVDAVLIKGLAKAPEARWPSCAAMVEALDAAVRGEASAQPAAAQAPAAAPEPRAAAAHSPPAAAAWRPRRRAARKTVLGVTALIAVLVTGVVAAVAVMGSARPPAAGSSRGATVALSAHEIGAGQSLVVSATNLPRLQSGTIELQSTTQRLGVFKADKDGSAQAALVIPRTAAPGAHHVAFCWSGTCPSSAPLTVLQPLPEGGPSPPPSAAPAPAGFHPQITTVLPSPVRLGGTLFVSGAGFDPAARGITVVLIEYGHDAATVGIQDRPVDPAGSFTFEGRVPTGNFQAGQGVVRVCNIGEPDLCADRAVDLAH